MPSKLLTGAQSAGAATPAFARQWHSARWAAPATVIAGTTTRYPSDGADQRPGQPADLGFNVGKKSGDSLERITANRERLGQLLAQACTPALQAPPHLHWLQQVHGDRWVYADGAWADEPEADALWTDQIGAGLVIQSADCVPILLASKDPAQPCVGAAHGGWRGLLAGVIEQLVGAMPTAPSQLCAWIGPCISQRHFEVGEDVWLPVAQVSPSVIAEHPTDSTKRLVNLPQLANDQLRSCGVASIAQSGLCSYADSDFYSHRQATHLQGKGAQTGRMASVVCITG